MGSEVIASRSEASVRVGTAGWAVSAAADAFPAEGSTLQRYASRFSAVEINSSFHRRHRPATWARWAAEVPAGFRFSVKLAKTITHQAKLVATDPLVAEFADDVAPLGDKLGVVLVQLPPSLAYDPGIADAFFATLRGALPAAVACEPRHASWFDRAAERHLAALGVARVAADPARVAEAATPGGDTSLTYWRLHGSPAMYRSSYDDARLRDYASQLAAAAAPRGRWCIFDNTASSAAVINALTLSDLVSEAR